MASRFWVGGTGNWDASTTTNWAATSGGAGGQSVPTSSDDVTFDSASNATAYTVTVTATANCRDITLGNPLAGAITFAGSSAMNVAGNFAWASGMTRTYSGLITFTATSGTKTITSNSITFGSNLTFNGSGGTFQLADNLSFASATITLTAGTFDPNGKSVTVTNTSTNLNGGAFTFYDLIVTGAASVQASFNLGNNLTVTNSLTINGASATTARIFVKSGTAGTVRTITSAANTITNADFQDITGAGAASWNLSAISGLSGDCGGNSGITFTTPVDQHWIKAAGAGGNWSGGATNWTTRTPLPQDDVYFDNAFGTSQTVTADMPRIGKNVDFTGATWTTALTLSMSVGSTIFGSLTLISGLTYTGNPLIFGARSNVSIKTFSVVLTSVSISSSGFTVSLSDSFSSSSTLLFVSGNFDAAGFNVTATLIGRSGNTAATITLGGGTWTATSSGLAFDFTAKTVVANTSLLKCTDTSNSAITFAGNGQTFNNVWFARGASTGANTITGSNTFADFKTSGTEAHSFLFTSGTTNTVTTFTVSGSSGKEVTINTAAGATTTHALVKAGGGTISCDYLNIQHSVATPANTWYAGANSTNNQGVSTAGSGWIFTVPPVVSINGNFLALL